MPDNETAQPQSTSQEGAPAEQGGATATSTAPLTIEAIRAAILPDLERHTKAAYDAARRAEAKAERAPEILRREFAPLRELIEEQSIRALPEEQQAAYRAGRKQAEQTREDPAAADQREREAFQQEAASFLAKHNIRADDPVLVAAYREAVANAQTPAQWRLALGDAVSEVHRADARKAREEVSTREQKAREDERAKTRNESRETEGKVDKGQASSQGKKDWLRMSPEDFAKEDAAKEAAARQRRMNASR